MILSIGIGWYILIAYVVGMLIIGIIVRKKRASQYLYSCSICGATYAKRIVFQSNNTTKMIKLRCDVCKKQEWFVEVEKKRGKSLSLVDKDSKKIVVMGFSGSGKSTLTKQLSKQFFLPAFHLDQHYFQVGWKPRPIDEVKKEVKKILQEDAWIVDGNYSELYRDQRLKETDEIVIFLFSKRLCYKQIKERYRQHKGKVRDDAAPGCVELLDKDFKRWVKKDGRTKRHYGRFYEIVNLYPNKTYILNNKKDLLLYCQKKGIDCA